MSRPLFGKYRGTVMNNIDELKLGRLQVRVPTAFGTYTNWAMPCLPYAGPGLGWYVVPPSGASVWVEFEQGKIEAPIWTGCFWNPGQAPVEVTGPETMVFKTPAATLTVSLAGEIKLTVGIPDSEAQASVTATPENITIAVGQDSKAVIEPTSILLNTGEATISMGAAAITLSLGESSVAVDEAAVSLNGEAFTVAAL